MRDFLITEEEHWENITNRVKYLDVFQEEYYEIERYFEENNLSRLSSCITNYRDAMFHYRKVYENNLYLQNENEYYALKEHINRALKDCIIYLFQCIAKRLEQWYMIEKVQISNEIRNLIEAIYSDSSMDLNDDECVWYIWQQANNANQSPECVLRCIYQEKVYEPEIGNMIQRHMHLIKNDIMELRHKGADIVRPMLKRAGIKEYKEQYECLMLDLEKYHIKGLFVYTDVIL